MEGGAGRRGKREGLLVLDDTTLDKPYAEKMELVTYHWSGKHGRVVKGIKKRGTLSSRGWGVETYHRGVKQCCGVEKAQVRGVVAQLNHLACSIRAFIRLEVNRLRTGVSWYEAKASIIRGAIRDYLINPILTLTSTA